MSRNPERDARIIKLLESGMGQADVAREMDIDFPAVCGVVRRYREQTGKWNFARTRRRIDERNAPPARPPQQPTDTTERNAQIVRLVGEGMKQRDVAKMFGLKQPGVSRILAMAAGRGRASTGAVVYVEPQPPLRDRLARLFAEADRLINAP